MAKEKRNLQYTNQAKGSLIDALIITTAKRQVKR